MQQRTEEPEGSVTYHDEGVPQWRQGEDQNVNTCIQHDVNPVEMEKPKIIEKIDWKIKFVIKERIDHQAG